MILTVKDHQAFPKQHSGNRLELVDGAIIVMSPSGFESEEIAAAIIAQLWAWVHPHKLGRVKAFSAGFKLPTTGGDMRAPDVSFVKAGCCRMAIASRHGAEVGGGGVKHLGTGV